MPQEAAHLMRWFMELGHGRPIGGMGVLMPIPSYEIESWSRLARIQLEDWEIDTIRALDAAYLKAMAEGRD